MLCAGIAAANYLYVGYFPTSDAYDDFYGILTGVVDIGIPSFKDYVIKAFVEYLHTHVDDASADWFEQNWTGPRGRYCLCDAGYGGFNNNMGIKVDWRDIKKQCPATASLGTFLGALWESIKQLGMEHQSFPEDLGDADNFPESLSPSKEIFDMLQDSHPKTLKSTSLLTGRAKLVQDYPDYVEYVEAQGDSRTPLHLKIQLSHEMRSRDISQVESLKIENFYTALMPTQKLLERLDPHCTRTVEEVDSCWKQNSHPPSASHQQSPRPGGASGTRRKRNHDNLQQHPLPQAVPCMGRDSSAVHCFKNCVCVHGVLFASLFNGSEDLRVLDENIAATVGLHKRCRMIKGTAGAKRRRLLREQAATKKKVESKIKFMKIVEGAKVTPDGSGSKSKTFFIPEAEVPGTSSEDEDFASKVT